MVRKAVQQYQYGESAADIGKQAALTVGHLKMVVDVSKTSVMFWLGPLSLAGEGSRLIRVKEDFGGVVDQIVENELFNIPQYVRWDASRVSHHGGSCLRAS